MKRLVWESDGWERQVRASDPAAHRRGWQALRLWQLTSRPEPQPDTAGALERLKS